ncbi:MAG: HD-GYP domain-containing protein [Chloroflexi bacterium]|nr:HD-GYP domain-containing protein [Chloroflexota bacterium]
MTPTIHSATQIAPADRGALRRLGLLKLTFATACLGAIALKEGGVLAAPLPALLAGALAAGGLVVLGAAALGRATTAARFAAMAAEFGAVAAAWWAPQAGVLLAPEWWNAAWLGPAIVAAGAINSVAAPARAAAAAALAAGVTGGLTGNTGPAAAIAISVAAMALVAAPLRRRALLPDLPAHLARTTVVPAAALHTGEADRTDATDAAAGVLRETNTTIGGDADSGAGAAPIGEADLRAAAALLGHGELALLVNEPTRPQRTAYGTLHVLYSGTYCRYRVPLDESTAGQPAGLGCFPPPGAHLPASRRVKLLHGQSGTLGRLVLSRRHDRFGWTASAGREDEEQREALLALLAATWSLRLDNHVLAQSAESRLLDTVESLITSVEAKDPYTSGHSKRVCKYTLLLAQAMGIQGKTLDELTIGAALHDVGKLGIPEQVLSKPAKLDHAEWDVVRAHPKVGARIIDSFNRSTIVLHAIFHHHERFDGHGYPTGLAGEAIPLAARIVGVADALDAMTSGRAYQRNRSTAEALAELRRSAGTQFDPTVVAAALRVPAAQLDAAAQSWRAPAPPGRGDTATGRHAGTIAASVRLTVPASG